MPTTPRGLRYPTADMADDVPLYLQQLAEDVDDAFGDVVWAPPPSGDGTGATDTAALQALSDALPASGAIVLLRPRTALGVGYIIDDTVTFNVPVTLLGQGSGDSGGNNAVTAVTCTQGNLPAFDFTVSGWRTADFLIKCSAVAPVAGSTALHLEEATGSRVERMALVNFYDCADYVNGYMWWFTDNLVLAPWRYGLRIRDVALPDGGDMTVRGNQFVADLHDALAACLWESGGGLRWSDNKVNTGPTQSGFFAVGVDIAVAAGASTGVILINHSSIENVTLHAIRATTAPGAVILVELQINDIEMLLVGGANQEAILIDATNPSEIVGVVIDSISARSATPRVGYGAVKLRHVERATIGIIQQVNYGGALLTDTCLDVHYLGRKPSYLAFSGAGDITTNSAAFADLGASIDINATAGDVLEVQLHGVIYPLAADGQLVTFTIARADDTELLPQYLTKTVPTANIISAVTYVMLYTVAEADIVAGRVTLKPRWKTSSSTTYWLNSSGHKGLFKVTNLGPPRT